MENRTELYQVIIADFAAFTSFIITASVPADYTAGCALITGITSVIGLTFTGFYIQEKIISISEWLKKREKPLRVNRKGKGKKENSKCIISLPILKVKPILKIHRDYCEVVKYAQNNK